MQIGDPVLHGGARGDQPARGGEIVGQRVAQRAEGLRAVIGDPRRARLVAQHQRPVAQQHARIEPGLDLGQGGERAGIDPARREAAGMGVEQIALLRQPLGQQDAVERGVATRLHQFRECGVAPAEHTAADKIAPERLLRQRHRQPRPSPPPRRSSEIPMPSLQCLDQWLRLGKDWLTER